jgi:hypothetical protein
MGKCGWKRQLRIPFSGFTTFAGVWYHADRNKSANEGGRLCQTPENNRRRSRQKNA